MDSDETSEEAEEEMAETNKSRQVQGLVDISDLPVDELGLLLDPIGALEEELDKCKREVEDARNEARGVVYSPESGVIEEEGGVGLTDDTDDTHDIESIDVSVTEKETEAEGVGGGGGGAYCVNLTGEGVEMMKMVETEGGEEGETEGGGGKEMTKEGEEREEGEEEDNKEEENNVVVGERDKDEMPRIELTVLIEHEDGNGINISKSSSRLTDEESGATDFDSEEEGEEGEEDEESEEEESSSDSDITPRHKLFRLLQKQSKLLQLTGNTASARATLQEMIDLVSLRESDDSSENDDFTLKLAHAQHDLGTVARMENDFELSCCVLEKSIKLKSDILGDHSTSVASSLSALSLTKKLMGKEEEATILNRKAMRIFHETDTTRSREGGWWG
ncbi:hypothetical protein TL16_g00365 [Triparma laevis f. inornata]|uniref:Uncharacterized protein n=1 Tax=Triparma laevis f. inornata TaxID=1714386 RepID=A0A9W6ZEQ6_9STRA|nr:hypothetical protein TL16_g00365 [Triparma laevis f. inornata]